MKMNYAMGYAAVGSDGTRLVVWGIGDTEREAKADAVDSMVAMGGATVEIECYPITAEDGAVIEAGDVSWPPSPTEAKRSAITGTEHDDCCENCETPFDADTMVEGDLGFYCSKNCRLACEDDGASVGCEDFHADD